MMDNDIRMFVPFDIEKGEAKDRTGKNRKVMLIKGVASTAAWDADGESLDPNGFDYNEFIKSGFFNWNHQANSNPLAIVGEPTHAEVKNNEFIVKGFLYEDNPLAQKIYKVGEMLKKSGSTRRLGFSIEGKATERDPLNKKRVIKANVNHVAIAPSPKNKDAIMDIGKSDAFEFDPMSVVCDGELATVSSDLEITIIKADQGKDEFFKAVLTIVEGHSQGLISDESFANIKASLSGLELL